MLVCLVSGWKGFGRASPAAAQSGACHAQAMANRRTDYPPRDAAAPRRRSSGSLPLDAIATCHHKKRLMMRLQMMPSQMYLMDEFLFSLSPFSFAAECYLQGARESLAYHHIIIIIAHNHFYYYFYYLLNCFMIYNATSLAIRTPRQPVPAELQCSLHWPTRPCLAIALCNPQ